MTVWHANNQATNWTRVTRPKDKCPNWEKKENQSIEQGKTRIEYEDILAVKHFYPLKFLAASYFANKMTNI